MNAKSLGKKTDLHVFHFRNALPLGGDLDAAFTGREIVDWAERFEIFDRFVLGNHPPRFFRISTKLSAGEYLDAVSSLVEGLRPKFPGRLFKGIECDFLIKGRGKIGFNPGERLLIRYNPDVSLIAFHFHKTLTYANRFEIAITDLTAAFKWAIDSNLFQILAHPFDVLERIYQEDRRGFEEVANSAREKKVAFEINADKGFDEEAMEALIKNGNLFSFGGDLHALSHWLKQDKAGLEVKEEDAVAMERLLGLTAEVADKEKRYWRELDSLFWHLPYPSEEKRALRNYAAGLYKGRGHLHVQAERERDKGRGHLHVQAKHGREKHSYPSEGTFERGLNRILAKFAPGQKRTVGKYLQELHSIYNRWGGAPQKALRMRLEKYFLGAPLTANEIEVYEQWLVGAYDLGLKKENLLNTWDTLRLKHLLRR